MGGHVLLLEIEHNCSRPKNAIVSQDCVSRLQYCSPSEVAAMQKQHHEMFEASLEDSARAAEGSSKAWEAIAWDLHIQYPTCQLLTNFNLTSRYVPELIYYLQNEIEKVKNPKIMSFKAEIR